MRAARRAVGLDRSLAEAHSALAMASLMGTWDRAEAEREFLRSIELNPRYPQARAWYAFFYLQLSEGQLAEGMLQAKLALESDPLSAYAHALYSLTCMVIGKIDEAIKASRHALVVDPENYLARITLQGCLWVSGEFEESIA